MSNRLKAIRGLVPEGRGVIDVGTDHGYLPIQLYKDSYAGRLFASDLRSGPLSAAKERAKREGAEQSIRFLLCDGLDGCPPESVDTIVIAGMGGDTICGILDRAEFCMSPDYLLILQPMTKAEVLRFWLVNNGFVIEREELVKEGEIIYQLLTARFQDKNTPLIDAELYVGAMEQQRENPLFPEHLAQQRSRLETSLVGLQSAGQRDELRMRFLANTICQMRKMEESIHDNRC